MSRNRSRSLLMPTAQMRGRGSSSDRRVMGVGGGKADQRDGEDAINRIMRPISIMKSAISLPNPYLGLLSPQVDSNQWLAYADPIGPFFAQDRPVTGAHRHEPHPP